MKKIFCNKFNLYERNAYNFNFKASNKLKLEKSNRTTSSITLGQKIVATTTRTGNIAIGQTKSGPFPHMNYFVCHLKSGRWV